MQIDLDLYRQEVRVSVEPDIWLSVIDIHPEHAQHTLVFLHGYAGKASQWIYQLNAFGIDHRVIAIDLRGHGHSDKPRATYDMPTLLADLIATLDSLGVNQPVTLVGHSFGGAIATEFAHKNPERVERLVLIATAGQFKLNTLYRTLLKLPYPVMRTIAPITRNWLGAPPAVLKALYENSLERWTGWSIFGKINVPTLIIRGHLDLIFAQPLFEEVAKTIPASEDLDVGASGHMVMLERRQAVNRAIQRFIESETRPQSWRGDRTAPDSSTRTTLLSKRPWLTHYDSGVPTTIAVPRIPLFKLLDSAVRRFPFKTAMYFEGMRITYLRLGKEANRFANALIHLGIQKGDRVMLLLPNLPQMVVAFFGALKAGAVVVFTLPTTDPDELIRQVKDSGTRVLVTLTQNDDLIFTIKNELEPGGNSPLEHIIFTHFGDYLPMHKRAALMFSPQKRQQHLLSVPMDASMHIFNDLVQSHKASQQEINPAPQDLAVIIYTGGTTDAPKGVMLSHQNLVANTFQTRHWIPDAREGGERFLCVLPFSHSYGLTTGLTVPVSLGATMVVKSRFIVLDTLQTIKHTHPTIFPGVPRMYMAIKDFPGVRRYDIQSIKSCLSGSAPLPVEVQEAFEKLTRGRLVEGYGLTEASPVTHANPLNGLRKVGSIGVPFPSTEARVIDLLRGQKTVPIGQIGELAVRGPQVMMGYWNNPEETARTLTTDGWLLTGDVAQMDPDGYFRIIARKVDMWYPSKPGEPAFPRDVEEVLFEVPQVKEAVVVAFAGQPVAFVITKKERPSSEALIAYCKRRLPPELVPRLVIFVDDFPRSFIGKVLRRELAKRLELDQASSFIQDS